MKQKTLIRTLDPTQPREFLGRVPLLLGKGALPVLLACGLSASAGSFFSDFNSGLPAGTALYGLAEIGTTGGLTNSGCLKLTSTTNTPAGSGAFVITDDLDAGTPVVGFRAAFKAYVGGGNGADGFSFNFATDLPADGNISEEGAGTGLTVAFDTYANDPTGGTDLAGIDIKIYGGAIVTLPWTGLRTGTYVDVVIQLHPNGTLDVIYDGNHAYTNLNLAVYGFPSSITGGHFGLGGRIGGLNDNHWIDNLSIQTYTSSVAFLDYYSPIGRSVRADAPIQIVLTDYTTAVVPSSIVLQLDGTPVTPVITQSAPSTTVAYVPPALFASNSSHSVSLTFADDASPTANTNTFQYGFTVLSYSTLPSDAAAAPALVDTSAPGFKVRFAQAEDNTLPGNLQRAEQQLAGLIIDGVTGLPITNIADPNSVSVPVNVVATNVGSYTYLETNVLNYASGGNFANDLIMPGLPGTTADSHNYALDAVAYVHLAPGFYKLGVNSADGFSLTLASTPDVFAPVEAVFDGPRLDPTDSMVAFSVTQDGYYPFRVLYLIGQLAAVGISNPGTDTPSLEFFNEDINGVKILINDATVAGHLAAYRPAATLPYIRSVSPSVGQTAVSRSTAIDITLVDGSIAVDQSSIQLSFNGAAVTPTVTSSGGVTTVHYQPPSLLSVNTKYTVEISFTDTATNSRTNSYQFTTENILTQLWIIPPGSANATWAKWVTTGSTERGLAYNPKTGHVLLVSRSAATGADGPNGKGIAVLDGNTGLYLKQLAAPTDGFVGGTFVVNMVDVADDGVIYVCSLATSGTSPFKIYRWQNEDDPAPIVAYTNVPTAAAGTPRWGDDFAVRGSGAGTQIIASGNNASANSVPIFTTTDGTNFNVAVVVPTGMPNNASRLGIGFGCGKTFYAKNNAAGALLNHCSFTGPPSYSGNLLAGYDIRDRLGNEGLGPIGVDIVNQRLMGDTTIGGTVPHSLNLYDLDLLSTSGTNGPIDSKSYATSTGSFGTGAVDFSPGGTRVYALDTGNGIIAFSLAPKLAAPTICAQPQNFIVSPLSGVGFMDVGAIGAPQHFQWRFSGLNPTGPAVPLNNATNRTLDLYNVQQSQLGWYSVVITNPMGSVTSVVAYLDTQMAITTQPASQVVPVGGAANFTVQVANGVAPYAYQWQLNGGPITDATASSLAISPAQVADAGGYTVTITDVLGQSIASQVAVLTVGNLGTGTGLTGGYFNIATFTENTPADPFNGPPAVTRLDETVNFDWGEGSPDYFITTDYFTARWNGEVQPIYSQTYTFYTSSDDGTRLWVDGQLVVDNWFAQPATERSGTIDLVAEQKYDLLMEYFERAGAASAKLSWSSLGQVKEIIPKTQLYPGVVGGLQPALSSSLANGTNLVLNWAGTFVLESAPEVSGPWTPILTNVSPFTVDVGTAPQMFYRLLNQD